MEAIQVLAQDGRVLCEFAGCCALCDRLVRADELDVFEGPGQSVLACVACIGWLGDTLGCDPGEPGPEDLGWSDLDDAAQGDDEPAPLRAWR